MTLGNKVFVSSTCYDLIDLRADVQHGLRDMGLAPVLSDDSTSDFEVAPDKNSIETCLVNVDACDHVIFVLSQRYGPKLEQYEHPELSATHAEYRRAVEKGKPIYFYVRDRLLAEYQLWKKNPTLQNKYPWSKKDAPSLFNFIKEHETPPDTGSTRSNWIKTFRSSIDLIEQIQKDLAAPSGEALLRELTERGELPEIRITIPSRQGPNSGEYSVNVAFRNHGTVAALEAKVRLRQEVHKNPPFKGLATPIDPGNSVAHTFHAKWVQSGLFAIIDIEYHARGWRIMETFTLDKDFRYGYQGKTLVEPATTISQLSNDPWQ